MRDLLSELHGNVLLLTFNRVNKHNAFDDLLLAELQLNLNAAEKNPHVRIIVLKANGQHFSAGADIAWLQRLAQFSEAENLADAKILADVMYSLHSSTKATIAMVHGSAFGGGAGLVAACDISIAAHNARFCFSEVKLGLIPAVISPYVIKAIGARAATWLFSSAEIFDAQRAHQLQLVQHCVPEEQLLSYTLHYAEQMAQLAPEAMRDVKLLVNHVAGKPINAELVDTTAGLIAKKRSSPEGQRGLNAFINKEKPNWD